MAVSGKSADFDIPFFLESDAPPNMATVTEAMAKRLDELLGEVDLSQLTGGAGLDGRVLLVKDGFVAFVAMKGDATIAEDGTLAIGNGVITDTKVAPANKDGAAGTAAMRTLGNGAKQAAPGNDARLSNERTPLDGSATSRKLKPTVVEGAASADLNIREAAGDVAGTEVEINAAVDSLLLVTATFDFKVVDTHDPVDIGECFGTFLVDGAAGSRTARFTADMSSAATQFRGSVALTEVRELAAGDHTLKLHAKGTAFSLSVDEMRCMAGGTGYTALLVSA